jgi:hypothetical protein
MQTSKLGERAMHFLFIFGIVLIGWKWGNWQEWQKYYPTILFFIACDLFANVVTYNYPLWQYQETIFAAEILRSHTIITLFIMLIVYPITTVLYLSKFPEGVSKSIRWILLWVFLYWIVEFINVAFLGQMIHENGWNIYWSFVFNIVMFTTLWVHHKWPLFAWLIAIIWSSFIIIFFQIPISALP